MTALGIEPVISKELSDKRLVTINVLLDVSGSMATPDCFSETHDSHREGMTDLQRALFSKLSTGNTTRKRLSAQILQTLATGDTLAKALADAGHDPGMLAGMNMRIIAFACRSGMVMSSRIERCCPECGKYEFDDAVPCVVRSESPTLFPAQDYAIGGHSTDVKVPVKYCSDTCNTPTTKFICISHPDFGLELPSQTVGSAKLPKVIFERAMEDHATALGGRTNVHLAMKTLSGILTEDGTTVRCQRPMEVPGKKFACAADMVSENAASFGKDNTNPIQNVPIQNICLYLGDDQPNMSQRSPMSLMAVQTDLGAKCILPTVVVRVGQEDAAAQPGMVSMKDIAFRDTVVTTDGRGIGETMAKISELLVAALQCTQALAVKNSLEKTIVCRDPNGSNFKVVPGETLTVLSNPTLPVAAGSVYTEDCSAAVIASAMVCSQGSSQRNAYRKRRR